MNSVMPAVKNMASKNSGCNMSSMSKKRSHVQMWWRIIRVPIMIRRIPNVLVLSMFFTPQHYEIKSVDS